jgi:hypothetical protein
MVTKCRENQSRARLSLDMFILTTILVWVVTGCQGKTPTPIAAVQPPEISEPKVGAPTPLKPGEEAGIAVEVSKATRFTLTYTWTADGGEIVRGQESPAITYRAPDEPGTYNVRVVVTWDDQSVEKTTSIKVEEEPTPTPTSTPTDTPVPPTDTPVPPTDTPVPPTDTPVPPTDTLVPPIDTPVPPTDTPVPPTAMPTPTPFYCTDSGGGGTETIQVEPPRTVARIRIDMEEKATGYGDSLWEVEAYGPDTGNLVIGEEDEDRARASSEQDSTGCEGCFAYRAIDGDMNTRWGSDWYDPQWLEITLPDPQVVNRIVLRWETAYAERYCVTVIEPTTPTCRITEPADGDENLGHENEVRATCSDVPDSLYASVLVYSHHDFNYYPQPGPIGRGSGDHEGMAYLGTEAEGIGDRFDIIVALADEAVSMRLRQDTESYSSYDELTLPKGVEEKDRITVTRGH